MLYRYLILLLFTSLVFGQKTSRRFPFLSKHTASISNTTSSPPSPSQQTVQPKGPIVRCGHYMENTKLRTSVLEKARKLILSKFKGLHLPRRPIKAPTGVSAKIKALYQGVSIKDLFTNAKNVTRFTSRIKNFFKPTRFLKSNNSTRRSGSTLKPRALRDNNVRTSQDQTVIFISWHVFTKNANDQDSEADGNLSEERIVYQIDRLNEYFRETPFQFALFSISRPSERKGKKTDQQLIFNKALGDMTVQLQASSQYRIGGPLNLNIFSVQHYFDPKDSFTTYGMVSGFPDELYTVNQFKKHDTLMDNMNMMDSLFLSYQTLPAMGRIEQTLSHFPGNQWNPAGSTIAHEVGHWMGLRHTFQDECSFPNDFVEDTRPQKQPTHYTSSCSRFWQGIPTVSCPAPSSSSLEWKSAPSEDIEFNLMDYGYDTCLRDFTPGQVSRMEKMWKFHRLAANTIYYVIPSKP